jgi:hypothetical protein
MYVMMCLRVSFATKLASDLFILRGIIAQCENCNCLCRGFFH